MYEELKKVAENATPGPWKSTVDGVMPVGDTFGIFGNFGANNGEANREFIAAANPSAVLALIEENEKIRGLLAEKLISQTMLTGIVPDNGGMTIGLEGGACAIMAEVFGEQLYTSGAENYIELSFASGKYPDLGQIVVTVKRETGKTPHQLRAMAEQERDQLKAENEALRRGIDPSWSTMDQSILVEFLRHNTTFCADKFNAMIQFAVESAQYVELNPSKEVRQ